MTFRANQFQAPGALKRWGRGSAESHGFQSRLPVVGELVKYTAGWSRDCVCATRKHNIEKWRVSRT
jgi:hypothetical protein